MNTYDRFKEMAIRRLGLTSAGGLGEELTIVRTIQGEYDPTTSSVVNTEASFLTSGLRINFKRFDIDGTLVKENDVNFYISPVILSATGMLVTENGDPLVTEDNNVIVLGDITETPEPLTTDVIRFLGTEYVVVDTRPWNFNGMSIGFKVHARIAG